MATGHHGTQVSRETPLKQALHLPLYLFLLTAAYWDESSSPVEILDLGTVDAVRDRLYELLITAGAVRNSETLSTYRDLHADQATIWLENLAETMARTTEITESPVDIEISRIPRIAGRLPRFLTALLIAAMTAPPLIVFWQKLDFAAYIAALVAIVLVITEAMGRSHSVTSFSYSQFKKSARRPINIVIAALALTSLGVALLSSGKISSVGTGVYFMVTFFSTIGPVPLFRGLRKRNLSVDGGLSSLFRRVGASNATRLVRSGVAATMINAGMMALLVLPFSRGLVPGALWLTGLVAMIMLQSPWPTYAIASLTFWFSRRFAGRPARFLDWAQEAGLIGGVRRRPAVPASGVPGVVGQAKN
ncbi:hypothetical protein GCM10029964_073370 [Kibdelosporangium lantanae]